MGVLVAEGVSMGCEKEAEQGVHKRSSGWRRIRGMGGEQRRPPRELARVRHVPIVDAHMHGLSRGVLERAEG